MTMQSSGESPGTPMRLHGLDAVRGGAFLLTVTFHAALSFLPGPQIWVTRDASDMAIADFFILTHMSHMLIFFVLAGLFARMAIESRGPAAFARDRLLRVTLPAMVFWLPVMVGIIATFVTGAMAMKAAGIASGPQTSPAITLATFPLTHLWFLYALTLAYAAALGCVALGRLVDRNGRFQALVADPAMHLLVEKRLLVPVLAVPMALLFLGAPGWLPSMGIPTPDSGFVPNGIACFGYGAAFLIGWLLHRQQGLLGAIRRDWLLYCVVAAVASTLVLIQITPERMFQTGSAYPQPWQPALLYAVAAWSWTVGLIGLGLRFFERENKVIRYVSDASYWNYIVHIPVVMALQVVLFPMAAPALVKFAAVSGGSFLILFASYHLLVRHSFLGSWLNGRKLPWRKSAPAHAMEVATA